MNERSERLEEYVLILQFVFIYMYGTLVSSQVANTIFTVHPKLVGAMRSNARPVRNHTIIGANFRLES